MTKDTANTPNRARLFSSLYHSYFPTFLVVESLLSFSGSTFYLVSSWHALELTNSPFLLGVVTASRYVATLLFGGIAGVVADRVSRRKILIINQTMNMALMFTMAILISKGLIRYWHIVAIVTLWGVGGIAFQSVRFAIIPDMVGKRDLTNAMGLQMITMGFIGSVGSIAGGALIESIGFDGCYFLIGSAYAASILLLFTMHVKETLTERKESMLKTLVDGMRYIRGNQAILAIILIEALYNLLILPAALGGLMAVFARDVLSVGAAELGVLFGISGIGGLAASICVASLGDFRRKGWLYLSIAVTQGVILSLFSASRWYTICLILMVGYGFTNSAYNALASSLAMLNASDEVRGRVAGVKSEVIGTLVFGNLYSGAIANSFGSPLAIGLGGGLYVLSIVMITILAPKLRSLE